MSRNRTGGKQGRPASEIDAQDDEGPEDFAEALRGFHASRLVFSLLEARPRPRSFAEADRDVRNAIRRVARVMDEVPSECAENLVLECPIHAHYLKSVYPASRRNKAGSSRRPPVLIPEPPLQRQRSEAAYSKFLKQMGSKRRRDRLRRDYERLLARIYVTSILQMPEELDDVPIRRPKKRAGPR